MGDGVGIIYKFAVVGGGAVGKSSLTIQYLFNRFPEAYDPTVEDSYRKQVEIEGHSILLDILDTAGQEEFESMRSYYIDENEAFVLVYSITNSNSFEEVKKIRDQITKTKEDEGIHYVLLGNKKDLAESRLVDEKDGRELAESIKCPFFETSAKTQENVQEGFEALIRSMMKSKPIQPGNSASTKRKRKCILF
eukprot:TRINITY_DN893_c0_g1_i3.p1 TRINITY_DN893_c0_g1~~TRINITY_DN893_c0_g1_i3.p1  ORF type:complete len:211 (-),score=44.85 TRINITY_DN893_c0_g1_i3:21-599(-)